MNLLRTWIASSFSVPLVLLFIILLLFPGCPVLLCIIGADEHLLACGTRPGFDNSNSLIVSHW